MTTTTGKVIERIPISKLRAAPTSLRDITDKTTVKYKALVESIKVQGIQNTPSVTKDPDPLAPGEFVYTLVDGLQRTTAAKDAGFTEIDVVIDTPMSDKDRLAKQLTANLHSIDTTPVQYAKGLLKMLQMDPLVTPASLGAQMGMSEGWVKERLKLDKLTPDIAKLVDGGTINVTNGIYLSTLPAEEQANFIDAAISQDTASFNAVVKDRLSVLRRAREEGRDPNEKNIFKAEPLIRTAATVKAVFAESIDDILSQATDLSQPSEIIKLTLAWVLQLDPVTVEARRQKWQTAKDTAAAKAAAAKAERDTKRQAAAPTTPGS